MPQTHSFVLSAEISCKISYPLGEKRSVTMEQNSYKNYQGMVTAVTTGIAQMNGVCRQLAMETQADELNGLGKRLQEHVFSVGIMGEFKRGKSTVINALLGQEIVPADVVPCSATLNYVKWDANKRAEIHFKDGTKTEVSVDELANYVTKITEASAQNAENVEDAVVYYPCPFCQNGVQIVDTPGLNDDERMTEISEKVIPTLDAIIMVVTADSPFSQSEAEFVRNKVMSSDLGRIIFLVNKIDLIDEDDRPRLLSSIREKIQSSVLGKMEIVYGKDSKEYQSAKDKIGEIRLLPVSAKKALKGKLKNDAAMLQNSGYTEFESALSKLLTEERGMLELIHPVNQLLSAGKEATQTIETRLNALAMSTAEFEEVQKDSIAKIEETRNRKKEEIHTLRTKGKTLYANLLPEIEPLYADMESTLSAYVETCEIRESDIANDAARQNFSAEMSQTLNHEIENQLSVQLERLQVKIQEQLGRDIDNMEGFAKEFEEALTDIHINLRNSAAESNGGVVKAGVIEGVTTIALASLFDGFFLPGIGGIISGFREHGMKGAAVGGLTGAGISLALLTLLPGVGVVGLPLMLITGIAGSFGGKKITQLVFGKKERAVNMERIRDSLLASVQNALNELRANGVLENWLQDTCEKTYNQVADNMDQEWENSLQTLESTLSQIKIDLEMNAENRKKIEQKMQEHSEIIQDVLKNVQPIHSKLSAALNQS